MRLTKFLSIMAFVTCFCLLYVYQQTEIFRLAYVGQKRQTALQDSLDRNTILRYNINKATSLTRLDNKVLDNANFQMPDSYRLVKLTGSKESLRPSNQHRSLKWKSIAFNLFGIKREAEAKTIDRSR